MIRLKIHLDLAFQPMLLQKSEYGGRVEVVLVRGRLLGLGLDQNLTLETS